jgi:hypothetical protein
MQRKIEVPALAELEVRFRRVSPDGARSGEGPLSEP